ncbi:MAG TPA: right-handed parallel beta-helix repeat-containing protein, partial [bacterium]|nr:right-handed parallel beta-helix repeat-containing protein [bacterium]
MCAVALCLLGSYHPLRAAVIAVDGSVFLEGETDYGGVQVDFDRTYPSSLSYSAFSSLTGYYRQELEEGMYDVTYSEEGYLNGSFSDQTLYFGDITLPDMTLDKEGLSGPLSGTLNSGTYRVDSDISVESGTSLTIEAGTTLLFRQDCAFTIDGLLTAVGTEEDRIVFTRLTDGVTWRGIKFSSDAGSQGIISYSLIEHSGQGGLHIQGCSPTISFSEVSGNTTADEYSGAGISLIESSSLLDNVIVSFNVCTDDSWNETSSTSGVLCRWGSPEISNCLISYNTNAGDYGGGMFILNSDALVHHSIITHNQARRGGGVRVSSNFGEQVLFYNVLIAENIGAEAVGGLMTWWDMGTYINVSAIHNQGAGINTLFGLGQEFINCTTSGNSIGLVVTTDASTVLPSIQYCTLANNTDCNFTGGLPEGFGINTITNANGDPCDIYHNIQLDPLFTDFTVGDYRLRPDSPCIDSGSNAEIFFLSDLPGNRRIWDGNGDGIPLVDIGTYEYGAPARDPLARRQTEGFDDYEFGIRPPNWTFLGCGEDADCYVGPPGYFGAAAPSLKLAETSDSVITEIYNQPEEFSIWCRGVSTNPSSSLLVEEFYDSGWHGVMLLAAFPTSYGGTFGPYPLNTDSTRVKFTYGKSEGNLAFDDVGVVALPTWTPTPTPYGYRTPSPTPSPTPAPSTTPTPSVTPTPYGYRTPSATPTPEPTSTPSPTATPRTPPPTAAPTASPIPTPAPPELILTADPTGGRVPLTIDFQAVVLYGSEIQYYRWDYNG